MLAVKKISGLVFVLCIITAFSAPCFKYNHSLLKCINELEKHGTILFDGYAKATGINTDGLQVTTSNFPGLPNCRILKVCNQSQICDTLRPFEGVFKAFNNSMNDDLMSKLDKERLLSTISLILEVRDCNCTAPSFSNYSLDPDQFIRKMTFYNAFKDYKECIEQLAPKA